MSAVLTPAPAASIGRFVIERALGKGAQGSVYLAHDPYLERQVAIKSIGAGATPDKIRRLLQEARVVSQFSHPNIVTLYDALEHAGSHYLVLEYVEGMTLAQLLRRETRLANSRAIRIANQIADGLTYAHGKQVIHRDIKPANIMIARTGGVKVMDFGIARDTSFGDLTEQGTGIGTPAYMSPEQVLGDKLDARSDIFSLGVVLYQMVTGKKPFVEDGRRSAMHKIRLEKHVGVRKLNPEIPRELERVIDRCLEKQPRDRWRSAQHMVMALERFLAKVPEPRSESQYVVLILSLFIFGMSPSSPFPSVPPARH